MDLDPVTDGPRSCGLCRCATLEHVEEATLEVDLDHVDIEQHAEQVVDTHSAKRWLSRLMSIDVVDLSKHVALHPLTVPRLRDGRSGEDLREE